MFFSPLSKVADRAIYFACVNCFLFLNWAKLSQDLLDQFSRSFYQMEGICVNVVNTVHFFQLPQGHQFCVLRKIKTMHDLCNFYTIWSVDDRFEVFFQYLKGCCHGNQFCVVADLFTQSLSILGSAGPIFTIFAPYGRYWIANDQSDPLFPIS